MSQLPGFVGRPRVRVFVVVLNLFGVLAAGFLAVAPAGAQPKPLAPDAAAMMVLDSARRAYNEGNYPFAAQRFQEFLKQHGGLPESASAAYGLGLALLEAPQKDYKAVLEALQRAAGRQDFAERPYALYYMGLAQRGMGEELLAQAQAKPNEAAQYNEQATRSFQQALGSFAAAAAAFAERIKAAGPTTAPAQPAELEWLARARCDQCEMLLRTGRYKEAGEQAAALLADPPMAESRYRELALYYLGYAAFAQRDYPGAGRAMSKLAPFQQEFGAHARYLLARTHHLSGERPEAAAQYKALLAAYEEERKKAQESLKHSGAMKPEQRAALSVLANGPPPDYIPRAMYYSALIQAEEARFAEALAGFTELLKQYPKCSLAPEAQLRQGFCQLQLRNCPEAIRVLQPLGNHPTLGDQATWWLARAQVAGADPANAQALDQALRAAMENFRRAADLAAKLARVDPDAKTRRGDILLDLADTMQAAKQYKQAAGVYQQVLGENSNPDRAEEALQRQITALHLAGMYRESDDLARRFESAYPKSTLLPAVLFRGAENAYLSAMAASANTSRSHSPEQLARMFAEAANRYQRLVKGYAEFAKVNLARQGMAMAYYQHGKYAEAIAGLKAIPEADRTGELETVPYLLADCLIRTFPPETEDALQAAELIDLATQAAKLLEAFLGSQPKHPAAGDALLKLGHCYQRVGAVLIDPQERKKVLMQARGAYERMIQQSPRDPGIAAAHFEMAKCMALLGDPYTASQELRRFAGDPFRSSPVAPLALMRYSALLRAQNKAAEAVKAMQQCLAQWEPPLRKDPDRKDWVPMLQYEHALGVMESGKVADAWKMFDAISRQFPGRPEAANALWRAGQCRRQELMASLNASREIMARPYAKPAELSAANEAMQKDLHALRQTVEQFKQQAQALGKSAPGSEAHLRMVYETAWCYRVLGDAEIEAASQKLRLDALAKVRAKLTNLQKGHAPPPLSAPEVPMSAVPIQPSEQAAREQYQLLIAAAAARRLPSGEGPLAIQARLELAEMLAARDSHDAAMEMLARALENNPSPELAERIRLRLASSFLAKKNAKAALAQIEVVTKNAASTVAAEARYLAGEAAIQQKDWGKAIEQLIVFRDQGKFQNVGDVADRALLRLGHAFAEVGRWDDSRRSLETLVSRFGRSPWVEPARYGMGWAWQKQGQYDQAVNAYTQVTQRTAAEVAAQAQLQIGLCRLAQQRYEEAAKALLVVPFTYDYPTLNAEAWCEAAKAYLQLKQTPEAVKLWQRVIQDAPASSWAEVAKQSLAKIK